MKKFTIRTCVLTTLLALSTALTVQAEFSVPQQSQIDAAAANADVIGSLIEGASPEQAAGVVRAVVASILSQDLPAETKRSRIIAALRAAFRAIPAESRAAFAQALGTEAANTLAISSVPSVRSLIQQEIAAIGGETANLAQIFAAAYVAAMNTGGSGGDTVVTPREESGEPKPQPPVAPTYRGQQL